MPSSSPGTGYAIRSRVVKRLSTRFDHPKCPSDGLGRVWTGGGGRRVARTPTPVSRDRELYVDTARNISATSGGAMPVLIEPSTELRHEVEAAVSGGEWPQRALVRFGV